MKRTDVEELLWEMTLRTVEGEGDAVDDELLQAYRGGELEADAASRVADALEESPAARARLAELGGLDPGYAPAGVRRRLLGDEPTNGNRSRASSWRLAAAAALVLVLGGVAYQQFAGREAEHAVARLDARIAGAEFDVTVVALARARSAGAASAAEAYPDTDLEIRVEAREALAVSFELGVYRAGAGELRRVELGIEHEAFQGAASVSGAARAFIDSERPGEYPLWLLVAPAGRLPAALPLAPGAEPGATLAAAGGKVIARSIRLLAADAGDEETPNER